MDFYQNNNDTTWAPINTHNDTMTTDWNVYCQNLAADAQSTYEENNY